MCSNCEYILAIDPGNEKSAYVVLTSDLRPITATKTENDIVSSHLRTMPVEWLKNACIEMIGHYGTGMPAGKSVFDTCVWIGRFTEIIYERAGVTPSRIMRSEEKMTLCGTMKAKDGNIRRALIDRFAKHDFKNGKGTKKNPDWFYGFSADMWQAYAVAVTHFEKEGRESEIERKTIV